MASELPGGAGRREGRQGMKPMKPCKAWAVVDNSGRPTKSMYGPPMLRQTRSNARQYELYDDNNQRCSRSVRVRILEDAAVERAIKALREYKANDDDVVAAIRDLGGKP